MPSEVRIHVDVDATGHYRFRVRSGTHEITTSIKPDLAASFYEDLRLLRWKSAAFTTQGTSYSTTSATDGFPHRARSKMERTRTAQ